MFTTRCIFIYIYIYHFKEKHYYIYYQNFKSQNSLKRGKKHYYIYYQNFKYIIQLYYKIYHVREFIQSISVVGVDFLTISGNSSTLGSPGCLCGNSLIDLVSSNITSPEALALGFSYNSL